MDMKKILQAMDGVATKPVVGSDSMARFLRVVKEAEMNQPDPAVAPAPAAPAVAPAPAAPAAAPASTLSPEQLEYNRLRAQLDSLDALRDTGGSKNVFVSRDPALDAKEAQFRDALAKMAVSLKAKGIDAAAEYDAPEPGEPVAAPVDLAKKYVDETGVSRFLSIISEGKTSHKVTLPVQMAMQHYQKSEEETPVEIVESLFKTYVAVVEDDQYQEELVRQATVRQYGRKIAESVMKKSGQRQLDELSTELLGDYKKAAHADAKKADSKGDYARGDKRFKGINKATKKQFDNDLKKHKLTIEELEEAIKELKK
jgi:hypothetical protein